MFALWQVLSGWKKQQWSYQVWSPFQGNPGASLSSLFVSPCLPQMGLAWGYCQTLLSSYQSSYHIRKAFCQHTLVLLSSFLAIPRRYAKSMQWTFLVFNFKAPYSSLPGQTLPPHNSLGCKLSVAKVLYFSASLPYALSFYHLNHIFTLLL